MKDGTIAFIIRPMERTVQRARLYGGYKAIYKAGEYECFDAARFNEHGDAAFVDDEGLLHVNDPDNFFQITHYPQPLCGIGVVLGVDDEGESVEPHVSWDAFKGMVKQVCILRIGFADEGSGIMEITNPMTFLDDIIEVRA